MYKDVFFKPLVCQVSYSCPLIFLIIIILERIRMVNKGKIKQKIGDIKSSVSEKKEDVSDRIHEMKEFTKDKTDEMQDEVGKWRKMAPKLFV
jgi:uncharacterized protein YfkK (UPF0435 family)